MLMSSSACTVHHGTVHGGSGQLVFGSGQPIRVKKTRGARLRAWPASSSARDGQSFQQWLRLFLLYTVVWSKHNFDNFHFWAKIKHHFNYQALIPIVGRNPSTGDVPIIAQRRGKHTETQYLTWFGKIAYIHGRDNIIWDWRKDTINTWRISSLNSHHSCCPCSCCHCSSLFLSNPFTCSLLLSHFALFRSAHL